VCVTGTVYVLRMHSVIHHLYYTILYYIILYYIILYVKVNFTIDLTTKAPRGVDV